MFKIPPPGTKVPPWMPELILTPISRAIDRVGVYFYNRVIHPSNFGLYDKRYNPKVHGPYCHYRWYGKQDQKLMDVKLSELPAWFARREKTPSAIYNEVARNIMLVRHKWLGAVCVSPLTVVFRMIFAFCFLNFLIKFGELKDFQLAAYHWLIVSLLYYSLECQLGLHSPTHLRPIAGRERLAVFLRFLSFGPNYAAVATLFAIGDSTVQEICRECLMEKIIANYGSSSESEDEQVKTPRKLKSYPTEFKLKVAKHAKDISIHGASNKFKVGRSTVRQWMRQEKQLHKIA
uniref:Uncharacterized protein n=1 Tax=Ditylenchus dipsaci TaxID=166011 RepID=A0A915DEE1_9BILA